MKTFISLILLMCATVSFAQELRLNVRDKPLNVVLNSLNVEISFDDNALSNYKISVSKTFASPEEAINYLLKDKPFKMERLGNVLIISPVSEVAKKPESVAERKYILTGEVSDPIACEPLPYAHIQTEQGMTVTNRSGAFTLVQSDDRPARIQVYYIGFEMLDTVLNIGRHRLSLSPAAVALEEITVSPPPSAMLMQAGKTSGEIRINHQIARYMPGSADNSVFTLMRMLPGVRASGEPSDDLIVWGSNWGESRLIFDGFTIFGMKSFNDQIGSVNPYMAKDIRLRKGGYDASHGNRIGAIAELTGIEGDFNKLSVKANISNYTANLFASVPVRNSLALSVAYRQTFYNLYDGIGIGGSNDGHGQGHRQSSSEIFISPNYDFRDLNLKCAGRTSGNDRYYVSLYGADDRFKSSVEQQDYTVNAAEHNRQYCAAAAYNRAWGNGNNSRFLMSYSRFTAAIDHVSGITGASSTPLEVFHIGNSIQELSLNAEHSFNIGRRQQIQAGGTWRQYVSLFNGNHNQINNPALYVTNNLMLGKLSLQAGLRADWIPDCKIYVQPRVSARYAVSEEWSATASFGLYHQFALRVPYLYREESYQLIWNLTDSTFLSSAHYLAGLAYSRNGWLFSAEGYMKKNQNQSFFTDNYVTVSDNTLRGGDVYLKKEWRKHTFFGSYSVVAARMPQKYVGQEIKSGAIVSFKPFYFSATCVYGAGFPYLSTSGRGHAHGQENGRGNGEQHGNGRGNSASNSGTSVVSTEPYSRLDVSLICKWQLKNYGIQAGASLLNVFNANNIKYSYLLSDQNNVFNIYTKAAPRTPIVFFEIIF